MATKQTQKKVEGDQQEEFKFKGERLANPIAEPTAEQKTPMSDEEWKQYNDAGSRMYGQDKDVPTMTYDQVQEFSKTGTISGKSPSQSNIGPAGVSKNVQPTTKLRGVYKGEPEVMEYDKILRAMEPIETEEQRKEREKRERRDALFSAIGDGVSALSNLYFTTKGSPSADQSKSLSKAQMETVEKERKEREANMSKRLSLLKKQREAELALREQDHKDAAAEDLNSYRKSLTMMHQAKLANDQQYKTWYKQFKNEQAQKDAEHKKELERVQNEKLELDRQLAAYRTGKPYYNPNTGGKSGGSSSSGGGRHHRRRAHGGDTHRGNTRSNNRRNTRPQRPNAFRNFSIYN
jgi:hypothetical protein